MVDVLVDSGLEDELMSQTRFSFQMMRFRSVTDQTLF